MPADTAAPERLQKALARAGFGSRREIEAWIRAGRLTVNGTVAALGTKVIDRDQVKLDGRPIRRPAEAHEQVFILHRSSGEDLRDSSQGAASEALVNRLPKRSGRRYIAVSPMPHMDGGLELVTSDGALAERLQRSVRALSADFSVRVHGEFGAEVLERIARGELDSGARVEVVRCTASGGEGSNRWYELEAVGASGRDVRQLFERQGALVSRVLRTRLGPIRLGRDLARGQFRRLESEEVVTLMTPPLPAAAAASTDSAPVKSAGNRRSGPSPRGRPDRAG